MGFRNPEEFMGCAVENPGLCQETARSVGYLLTLICGDANVAGVGQCRAQFLGELI